MATSNNLPLDVMEYKFLKTYVTNKDEIIKKFNITNDAEWKKFYCEKLDLSKGSYAYNHNVTLVYISKRDAYVLIDYQLADAVEQLNELGLTTNACCSGHGNGDSGYMSFSTKSEKVLRFVNILVDSLWKYKFYIFKEKDRIVRWESKGCGDVSIKKKSKLMLAFADAINTYKNGQANEK